MLVIRLRVGLARSLRKLSYPFTGTADVTGVEISEGLARLAAVLSLLASHKIGRGGGWTRVRQRLARATISSRRKAPATSGRGSSSEPVRADSKQHNHDRLRVAVVVLWIGLLLSIVGYVELRGEAALADLERLGFLAVTP